MLRKHLKFVVLLSVFIVGVLVLQWALPIMEGNDESIHYDYVMWLRVNNRLPDRATYDTNSTAQASGQAPLTYWVAANVLNLLNVSHQYTNLLPELDNVRNHWFSPPDWSNRRDNFNQYYHGDDERGFEHPEVVMADRIGRLLSLCYGILAVIGAYGIAREFFRHDGWALTSTAVFAFTPQMLYLGAMLSNDITATSFATLTIWQTMVVMRRGLSAWRVGLVGVLLALAGLSKVSALLIAPGVLLAIIIGGRNHGLKIRKLLAYVILLGVTVAILIGPWMWFGWTTFQDPLGLKTHQNFTLIGSPTYSPLQIIAEVPATALSYWGKYGTSSIWLNPLAYILLTSIVLLSLSGYILKFRRSSVDWRSLTVQRGIVLTVMLIPALAALLYWLITLFPIAYAITGRLIYFIHGIFAVTLTGGLYLLSQRLSRPLVNPLRIYCAGILMAAGLLLTPLVIRSAFAEPLHLTQTQLPALRGDPVEYDHTIRFLGYTAPTLVIHAGSPYWVILCWEVLKPTTRDGVFTIKIFDQDGQIIANRTSVHGMGHFSSNLWAAGDIFCDNVEIPITGALQSGRLYNVIITMFDAGSNAPWQATSAGGTVQYPLIYRVISPAGVLVTSAVNMRWQPTTIEFPDLARVKGYAVDGTLAANQTVKLSLLWDVLKPTPYDWSEFIHLVGKTKSLSLGDSAPRSNLYPTWAWSAGEQFVETWTLTLPPDLPSGEYSIQIGFTERSAGQRIRVTRNGSLVLDGSAELLKFSP